MIGREDPRSVLERLVKARLEQAAPILHEWFEPNRLRTAMENLLAKEVDRLHSDELARLFAHYCPVAGAQPDDYRNRWLEVPGLGHALVGIRFWSLDTTRPFVTVVASTRLPGDLEELQATTASLRDAYPVFSPRQVRLFLPPDSALQPEAEGQYWEKRLLAAPVEELQAGPAPVGYGRVRLEPTRDTTSYPDYRRAYEELVRTSPEYREYTRLESEEDLAELAEAGTLFDIHVDGRWAGLTAVEEAGEEGVEGYLVIEILLAGHARGQRLGTAVQRHLVEKLPDKDELLLGTIDSRNAPALRAATRLGRTDLGGYLWTPLPRKDIGPVAGE